MSILKVVNKILLALAIVFLGLFVFAGLVLGAVGDRIGRRALMSVQRAPRT